MSKKLSVNVLTKKLIKCVDQLKVLEERKNTCVNKQHELEDSGKENTSMYQKQIDLDFELAEKIDEKKKEIKNLNATINRRNRQCV